MAHYKMHPRSKEKNTPGAESEKQRSTIGKLFGFGLASLIGGPAGAAVYAASKLKGRKNKGNKTRSNIDDSKIRSDIPKKTTPKEEGLAKATLTRNPVKSVKSNIEHKVSGTSGDTYVASSITKSTDKIPTPPKVVRSPKEIRKSGRAEIRASRSTKRSKKRAARNTKRIGRLEASITKQQNKKKLSRNKSSDAQKAKAARISNLQSRIAKKKK